MRVCVCVYICVVLILLLTTIHSREEISNNVIQTGNQFFSSSLVVMRFPVWSVCVRLAHGGFFFFFVGEILLYTWCCESCLMNEMQVFDVHKEKLLFMGFELKSMSFMWIFREFACIFGEGENFYFLLIRLEYFGILNFFLNYLAVSAATTVKAWP